MPANFIKERKDALKELERLLSRSPKNYDDWLQVGVSKKFFNNYEGARDAWEYAKLVDPNVSTAYLNLGGLYGAYLNDYPKAEFNYKTALSIDSLVFPYYYLALADFYENFYIEKKNQAESVLLQGAAAIPFDVSIKVRLGLYYKKAGFKDKAIKYLKEALAINPSLKEVREELLILSKS
mgnify:FL=1